MLQACNIDYVSLSVDSVLAWIWTVDLSTEASLYDLTFPVETHSIKFKNRIKSRSVESHNLAQGWCFVIWG